MFSLFVYCISFYSIFVFLCFLSLFSKCVSVILSFSLFLGVSLLLSLHLSLCLPFTDSPAFFLPITVTVPTAMVNLYEVGLACQLQATAVGLC